MKSPTQMIFIILGMAEFLLFLVESFFWSRAKGVLAWLPYVMVALTLASYAILLINERVWNAAQRARSDVVASRDSPELIGDESGLRSSPKQV